VLCKLPDGSVYLQEVVRCKLPDGSVYLQEVVRCKLPDGSEDSAVRNKADFDGLVSRRCLEGSVEGKCKQ